MFRPASKVLLTPDLKQEFPTEMGEKEAKEWKAWQKDQDEAYKLFYKKLGEYPEMTIPTSVRLAREANRAARDTAQGANAFKSLQAGNLKERITDNNGKDI
jgi:TRAP-type C4-dicarboxylate transport system substrate-binding protein